MERASVDTSDYVDLQVYHVPNLERPLFHKAIANATFEPAKVGDKFGPSWSTHWFKISIKIPTEWSKYETVIFDWNCGNEGLIFTEKGEALVGLSPVERQEWFLPKEYLDGEWHTFFLETSCNALGGNPQEEQFGIEPPIPDKFYTLKTAKLKVPNLAARALLRDFEILTQGIQSFTDGTWQKHRAIEVATAIMDTFDIENESSIDACRGIAKRFIGSEIDGPTVFSNSSRDQVYAVGHCHIDTAWLWPYAETRRKVGRSWASQLDLIERYPEYNFVCSQAVQYQWIKEDYPDIFERLKKQVKSGRFIPIGGSWVESDTNLPSGEAIARQFLYGQRFFESHFGQRCKTFWLPDTFGYSAQIPQICRGAGMDRFVTIKLSWNNINKFPHNTFNWVALDGSQVVCHMPPDDSYNSNGKLNEVMKAVSNNKSAAVNEKSLYLFGIGDGGGGPTEKMLEGLRRCRGVSDTVGGVPSVKMHTNVDTYFDEVISDTDGGKKLSTWFGELYFELHRGTFTTEALTKYNNRKTEVLMHDLELLATGASLLLPGYKYPKKTFDKMWQNILLNQFHDVLPGSAIEMVYDDATILYNEVYSAGKEILKSLATFVAEQDSKCVFLNTLGWDRSALADVDQEEFELASLPIHQQSHQDGKVIVPLSSGSDVSILKPVSVDQSLFASAKQIATDTFVLENKAIKTTINGGLVVSLVDLIQNREIIAKDRGANQFVILEDKPLFWQGWDTEVYSLNTRRALSGATTKILESGPLRASVLVEQQISKTSWVKTTISLGFTDPISPNPSPLEFDAEVEWRENSKFLKVEFPVDIFDEEATYDSMYGAVRRPTHFNTSWDMAKFEVCCHKFADLSDLRYGVTIINESKYGFATHGNVMRLSLLRSSKAPDGNADMGRHHIKYAIQPHPGRLNGSIIRAAWNFNHNLLPVRLPSSLVGALPPVRFEGDDNIIISAIKRGEDDHDASSGDLPVTDSFTKSVVVRLYDSLGGKSKGRLISKLPVAKAYIVNLLEDIEREIEVTTDNGVSVMPLNIERFEIVTVKLVLK